MRHGLPALVALVMAAGSAPGLAQAGEPAALQDRLPVGKIEVDATEVSVGRFKAFVSARSLTTAAERDGGGYEFVGGWTRRPGWTWKTPVGKPAADEEPAVHVSWFEARDYCAHVGGRLPSMAEWRQAAYTEMRVRPTDGFETGRTYRYPVGDQPDGMNTNRRHHVAVGSTKRGVNGLYDMGANVWEWIADRRGEDALTAGSSWWYGPENAQADGAQWKAAGFYAVYIGFRCVYDRKQ